MLDGNGSRHSQDASLQKPGITANASRPSAIVRVPYPDGVLVSALHHPGSPP